MSISSNRISVAQHREGQSRAESISQFLAERVPFPAGALGSMLEFSARGLAKSKYDGSVGVAGSRLYAPVGGAGPTGQ